MYMYLWLKRYFYRIILDAIYIDIFYSILKNAGCGPINWFYGAKISNLKEIKNNIKFYSVLIMWDSPYYPPEEG